MRGMVRSLLDPPITANPAQSATKLAWVVRLRWIALFAQSLAIGPALAFGLLPESSVPAFAGVISFMVCVNAATWVQLRRGADPGQSQLLAQLGLDIGSTSVLLWLSGGAWNPLVPILFVHAGLGALLLEGRLSLSFFGMLIACLVVLQASSKVPPALGSTPSPAVILFPAQLLVAVGFWFLTAWLSQTLDALRDRFIAFQERKTRIDRLRAVGALAAGLSHEFATPLNTAQLRLGRLARRRGLSDDEDVGAMREALKRCEAVLRTMAGERLSADGLSLEVVDVDDLVQRVCKSVHHAREGAPIRVSTRGRAPRRALLPTVAFSQGLINLIDNAAESTGGTQPIEVRIERHAGRIDVAVLDRGPGWPEVVRSHFGQPFVTTKPEGVGLGLYFVHTLAEAIGAELHLEDREPAGAVARISLPSALPDSEVPA